MPFTIEDLKKRAQQWAEKSYLVGKKIPVIGKAADILGKGLATVISLPEIEKTQREIEKETSESQQKLRELLRKPETPLQQKERIIKLLSKEPEKTLTEKVVEEAPTSKQVVGAATTLASTLLPFIRVKRLTTLPKVIRYPLEVGRSAVETGLLGGGMKAMEKEATPKEILEEAKKGAAIGAVTTGALIGAGKLLPKVGKGISKWWGRKVKWAQEEMAKPSILKPKSEIDKTLSTIGEKPTFSKMKAKTYLKIQEGISKLKTRFIDRFYPLKRIEDELIEAKGRPLRETEKVYRDARLLHSVADTDAENRIKDLVSKIKQYSPDVQKKAKAYLAQLDFIDRAKLGQKVPGGQTLDQLEEGLKKIVAEIGDDMPKVEKIRRTINQYFDDLLEERVKAGLISPQLKETLRKTHPNYIPHNVLTEIDEKAYQFMRDTFNVSKTDIQKAIGSIKNIQDPFEATIQRTPIATRVIEKNKLLNNLVRVFEENPELFPGVRKLEPIPQKIKYITKTGKIAERIQKVLPKIPSGFGKINLFRNGVKETWIVPQDVVEAIKNLDKPLTPTWFKILTAPNRLLKKFATHLNPSFAIPNKFRDTQTAALTSASFIDDLAKRYGMTPLGINLDALTPQQIHNLYRKSGGWGASIFIEGDEGYIWRKLTNNGIAEKIPYLNPLQVFEKINDGLETSTRLDVFKKALQAGLSPKDAALAARDATIDFAKMGSWMELLNRAIPFLNARVQGFVNLASSLIKQPEVFARTIAWTTVYPAIMLHAHNRRFESYKNISQYIKNKYWVIMVGETDGIDPYTGEPIKVPQFITIPKAEGQALVASPIQWYLEKEDKTDYRKVSELIVDMIGEASPMYFQSWDSQQFLSSTLGQFGPIATISLGLATRKHPYYGTPIVPPDREKAEPRMQFAKTTPEILKKVGEILKVSPAKIDFVLNSFGGMIKDFVEALDVAFGKLTGKEKKARTISQTLWGEAAQYPLVRRFIREATGYSSPEAEYRRKQKEEIEKKYETKRLEVKDKAEEIWSEVIKLPTREEKINYLKQLRDSGELTPEVFEKLKSLAKSRTRRVEAISTTDPVPVRAAYIIQRINEMKQENRPKEEILEFLKDLRDKKVMTKEVFDLIKAALQRQAP